MTLQEDVIQRGYDRLRTLGFELVEAPQCRKKVGHTAGTIQERVETIHDFFEDDRIDGLMAFWGGFQSHQLLEHLDYDLIRRHPKVLIGYSDVTALTAGIYAKTGLVGFSGPCGITFSKPELPDYSWHAFTDVTMSGTFPLAFSTSRRFCDNQWWRDGQMNWETNLGWRTWKEGAASGKLIGGNVGTLLLLSGTEYWPSTKGALLFVEEDEAETPETMDRLFTRLRQLGIFSEIRGLIVGRFPRSVGFSAEDPFEAILDETLRGYDFPVMYDVDFGHTDPLLTLPFGVQARMDTGSQELWLTESAVR